jgi:hypothetical protein
VYYSMDASLLYGSLSTWSECSIAGAGGSRRSTCAGTLDSDPGYGSRGVKRSKTYFPGVPFGQSGPRPALNEICMNVKLAHGGHYRT